MEFHAEMREIIESRDRCKTCDEGKGIVMQGSDQFEYYARYSVIHAFISSITNLAVSAILDNDTFNTIFAIFIIPTVRIVHETRAIFIILSNLSNISSISITHFVLYFYNLLF